jgi:hypothetical protein
LAIRDLARLARAGEGARFEQLVDHHRQVAGDRVADRDDIEVGGHRRVERGDDLRQALEVVGIVGDHQAVIARVGHDGIVGRDQGAQHGGQVGGRLVLQVINLGCYLVAGSL